MFARETGAGWLVHAPAKLNLYLDAVGRRADGFHEVETLIAPLSLGDTLLLRPGGTAPGGAEAGIRLDVSPCCPAGLRPEFAPAAGEDNLVVRALRLVGRRAGFEPSAHVTLWKRVPMQAGMGGGSADAAAALVAANAAWSLGWGADQLARLGAELGSDVPAALAGGPVVCRGRGEVVEPVRAPRGLSAVVVKPPVGLPTASVFARCTPSGGRPGGVAAALAALASGDPRRLRESLYNSLASPAALLTDWIEKLLDTLAGTPLAAIGMTGSGSACFGLTHDARLAGRVAARLGAMRLGWVGTARLL